jgi:hypothetical protein
LRHAVPRRGMVLFFSNSNKMNEHDHRAVEYREV